MGQFAVVPRSDWVLTPAVQCERRESLLRGRSYERVVADVVGSCSQVSFRRQRSPEGIGARCIVSMVVGQSQLDRFFSSSCGYRAQYLVSPAEAHLADRYAIELALPLVAKALAPSATIKQYNERGKFNASSLQRRLARPPVNFNVRGVGSVWRQKAHTQ